VPGYGILTADQRRVLAKHVRGQIVHDLGAGDCSFALELLKLGASEVYAIDKIGKPLLRPWPKRLHYKRDYFHNITSRMDTVFMSWPINYEVRLLPLVLPASKIIYLGKNTDGNMCGTPGLFKAMVRRELLDYEPDCRNCLIVTGAYLSVPRAPTGEEHAGISCSMASYYSYREAEARNAG